MKLTPETSEIIEQLAHRYYTSTDAVMALLQAVVNGGGSMAQFNHPDLGGAGQWMQGGMTMVGDMFNQGLKAKVDGLCSELSTLAANRPLFAPEEPVSGGGFGAGFQGQRDWWPSELGTPSATGAQNQMRYAVFPQTQRLAVDNNGQITVYDTLNHQIGGVGQQQGMADSSLTFASQFGTVRLCDLPIVSGSGAESFAPAAPATSMAPPSFSEPARDEADIFGKIERLAALREQGILTDGEFSAKKAELLSRI